jgi:pantoate--beta-alanine ligase
MPAMQIIRDPILMQAAALAWKGLGRRIGFVPTMGYLHAGHRSLIETARTRADVVVVSIFVNPLQFGPTEDLGRYPRDFERDEHICQAAGAQVVFYPDAASMYAPDHSVYVEETRLGQGLCGAARPGHFRGVTTVVAKLFNLVAPDFAVFGEKDAQQLRIIRRMVRDLAFPVEIIASPTVREADGLAMSSRNALLKPEERTQATCLRRALEEAVRLYQAGEHTTAHLKLAMQTVIAHSPLAQVDYIELVDDETMEPVEFIRKPTLVAVAVRFPSARLIDNVVLAAER